MRPLTQLWTTACAGSLLTLSQFAWAQTTTNPQPPPNQRPSETAPADTPASETSQPAPDSSNAASSNAASPDAGSSAPAEPTGNAEPAKPVEPPQPNPTPAPSNAPQPSATNPESASDDLDSVINRRGGFVLGVIGGPTLGWATGHPSDKTKRDNSEYERSTGASVGYRVTPFLGGALTDWFTFGLGVSFGSMTASEYNSSVVTFIAHIEVFPLYGHGGTYRDLGLALDFGTGVSTIHDKNTDEEVANSGALSSLGAGVFWEPLRFWHFATGPMIAYQRNFSRWYSRNDVAVGLRLMFYSDMP